MNYDRRLNRKRFRFKRAFALLLSSLLMFASHASMFQVEASSNLDLDFYERIIAEFNSQYGTQYKIASEEELNAAKLDVDEVYNHICDLDADEFWDELYAAYQNDQDTEELSISEEIYASTSMTDTSINSVLDTPTAITQYYYYHGYSNQYICFTFNRIYVSGQYHYITLLGYGSQLSNAHYPEYVVTGINSTTLLNSAQEMTIYYYRQKYVGYGIIQTVYNPGPYAITFSATGDNIWGSYGGEL